MKLVPKELSFLHNFWLKFRTLQWLPKNVTSYHKFCLLNISVVFLFLAFFLCNKICVFFLSFSISPKNQLTHIHFHCFKYTNTKSDVLGVFFFLFIKIVYLLNYMCYYSIYCGGKWIIIIWKQVTVSLCVFINLSLWYCCSIIRWQYCTPFET